MPTPTLKNFLADVRCRAVSAGIRPETIVAEAGLSVETWRSWERGDHSPNLRTMDAVYAALDRLEKETVK